jgi:hypothetical protein
MNSTPLKITSFQGEQDKEIDIARGEYVNLLIEIAVRNDEKTKNEVNFALAYTGKERCFLTTKKEFEKVNWDGIPIWRIPYSMLAAFFDRGEIPSEEQLNKK